MLLNLTSHSRLEGNCFAFLSASLIVFFFLSKYGIKNSQAVIGGEVS